MMNRFLASLGAALLLAGSLCLHPTHAMAQVVVVPSCSGNTPQLGSGSLLTDNTGNLCTNASLSGGSQVQASSTDASGTVTTGGTYQTVVPSNAGRKGCLIQNPTTATEIMSVKAGTMAQPYTLAIGAAFSCNSGSLVVTDTITVTAATTGHAFAATYQ